MLKSKSRALWYQSPTSVFIRNFFRDRAYVFPKNETLLMYCFLTQQSSVINGVPFRSRRVSAVLVWRLGVENFPSVFSLRRLEIPLIGFEDPNSKPVSSKRTEARCHILCTALHGGNHWRGRTQRHSATI